MKVHEVCYFCSNINYDTIFRIYNNKTNFQKSEGEIFKVKRGILQQFFNESSVSLFYVHESENIVDILFVI